MTPGLKAARARCAAASNSGKKSSSARNSSQADSREIDCAFAFSSSAIALDCACANEINMGWGDKPPHESREAKVFASDMGTLNFSTLNFNS
jgi:hypothetical protein